MSEVMVNKDLSGHVAPTPSSQVELPPSSGLTQTEPGKWSDSRKFWAETYRSATLGVAGALAVAFILNQTTDKLKLQRELRSQALATFLEKSYAYTAQLADFCEHNNRVDEDAFKSKTIDDFQLSMDLVELYFLHTPIQNGLNAARNDTKSVFQMCNKWPELPNGKRTWIPSDPAWISTRTRLIEDNKSIEQAGEKLL